MPFIKITTNTSLEENEKDVLLSKISKESAEILSKPEGYVMAEIEDKKNLIFGGKNEPCSFVEVKSLGLSESNTKELSKAFCNLISNELQIPPDRVYIEFASPPRAFWGWNNGTF